MAYTIWTAITMAFLPCGIIVAALILSEIEFFEKLGAQFCRAEIKFGLIRMTFPFLIVFLCAGCFCGEWLSLIRLQEKKKITSLSPLEYNDAWRALVWRHQRNWWLALSCLILWILVYRISAVVSNLRKQISAVKGSTADKISTKAASAKPMVQKKKE